MNLLPGKKMLKNLLLLSLLGSLAAAPAAAEEISITQVNPGRLLTRQTVELYVSVLDDAGIPVEGLSSRDFEIFESEDGEDFTRVPITDFAAHALDEGITFFLLIDNSGSMYETVDGESTDNPDEMRMRYAQDALRVFIRSMDDSRDSVQLASFNTDFTVHSQRVSDKQQLLQAVETIQQPVEGTGQGWTELYYSVINSLEYFEEIPGRKAVILLSDGENEPYSRNAGQPHPEFGEQIFSSDEAVDALQRSGVSLFSIRFGDEREESLTRLSGESGGQVFDTRDQDELARIYLDIREQILREYRIRYRADMIPSERRIVRARFTAPGAAETERTYFAGTLFGMPVQPHPAALIVSALLAIVGLFALTRISFVNKRTGANLEVLDGSTMTQVMPITQNKTVIGSSDSDDITLIGSTSAKPSHATVVFHPEDKSYRIESDSPVKVNNQKTTDRKLESGDVINVGGTMVVFDESEMDEQNMDLDGSAPPDKE